MSSRAPRIHAFVASAPAVPSAARHGIGPAVMAAAERHGGVVVRTCHRVEWYHETGRESVTMLAEDGARIPPGAAILEGPAAVERLVSLALGLESVVLGEDQILHQLRTAVADAQARGHFGGELALAFDAALRAGRLGRTWRPTRPRSIADIAIQRAEALVGELDGRRVLVVGSGEMGRLAARAALARGAQVVIASRDPERSDEVAARLGVASWPFDPGEAIADAAVVIVALGGPWTLAPSSTQALIDGPAVIDLSMPAALPEATIVSLRARHLGIDDLAACAPDDTGSAGLDPVTRRYRNRLVELRDRTLASYGERVATRRSAASARDLAEKVEHARRDALDALFRDQPHLELEDQAAIDAMTAQLTDRLFRSALERLAADGDGRGGRAVRDVFDL